MKESDDLLVMEDDLVSYNGNMVSKAAQWKTSDMEALYAENENLWTYRERDRVVHTDLVKQFSCFLPKFLCIVDLGCGEGYFAETMLTELRRLGHSYHYIGIDVSETAVERARQRLSVDPRVEFLVRNFEEDPSSVREELSEADLIVAVEALYYAKSGCTKVLKSLDPYIEHGTCFLNADSLGLYVCREFLHKKLGYTKLDRFSSPMWKDSKGRTHSLIAFLDQK